LIWSTKISNFFFFELFRKRKNADLDPKILSIYYVKTLFYISPTYVRDHLIHIWQHNIRIFTVRTRISFVIIVANNINKILIFFHHYFYFLSMLKLKIFLICISFWSIFQLNLLVRLIEQFSFLELIEAISLNYVECLYVRVP